ncbi:MAG: triphosphoribosyl-dephospho-CoA synthase MdcB [Gluconacetobacter diazotrophicus]|nr:triphosphoribosyl-dephospho-CoA synthase MdcB [Gluconacetobacter diazotrophicus]
MSALPRPAADRRDDRAGPRSASLHPDRIGRLAREALLAELHTDPKPGLVGPRDPGSHADMDHRHFERSAAALAPFFGRLAELGAANAPMDALRRTGLDAEAAMLHATGGVNTHRGAIFGLGLLCAAAGRRGGNGNVPGHSLGAVVAATWGTAILSGPIPLRSHGTAVLIRHGVGGARAEAAAGFPTLYRTGLPALRAGRAMRPGDPAAARVHCLFTLIAMVDDTNLLHRGGTSGAAFAHEAAGSFLAAGGVFRGDWRVRAAAIHRDFVSRRLSPGGCADLLAMTIFADRLGEPVAPEPSAA